MFGHHPRRHSVWLLPLNSGSCNGCDLEIQALHAARYALEEGGIAFAASPRHADILLLTGVLTPRSREAVKRVWEQLAEPRAIVAVGDCPINGSVFGAQGGFTPAGDILPIDVELPGCPPTPTLIVEAIEAAVKLLDEGDTGEGTAGEDSKEAESNRASKEETEQARPPGQEHDEQVAGKETEEGADTLDGRRQP